MDVKHTHWNRRLCSHGKGNQATDRRACRDAVAILDGHAMRHEATHREAREEDAIHIKGILRGERVEKRHQKSRVVGAATHQSRIPHGAVAFVARLRHHDGPAKFISDLREMKLIINSSDVVAQSMQEKQNRHGFVRLRWRSEDILPLDPLPFEILNLGEALAYERQ